MKLRKWLIFALCLVMAFGVFTLVACNDDPGPDPDVPEDDYATPGLLYNPIRNLEGDITGYTVGLGNVEAEEIVVPKYHSGKPVVSVGIDAEDLLHLMQDYGVAEMTPSLQKAFFRQYSICYSDTITKITLPDSLQSLGYGAFIGNTNLKEITVPGSVESITDYAFSQCFALEEVNFVDEGNLFYIGYRAFYDCLRLSQLELPDSVETIDDRAFERTAEFKDYGDGLQTIKLGSGLTSIGEYAFYRCYGLTEIEIPNSVREIGEYAFSECENLKTVKIGSGMKTIPGYLCWASGVETLIISDGVLKIDEQAFFGCESLTTVELGNTLEEICSAAFWACKSIEKIVLPDSCTTVGSAAFELCSKLKEVTLGHDIIFIDSNAFSVAGGMGVSYPEKIYYNGTYAEYEHVGGNGAPPASMVSFLK